VQNDRSPDTTALYAWLSRDGDGIEGIIVAPMVIDIVEGISMLPLVFADEDLARRFRPHAETATRARGFPARLVKFTRTDTLSSTEV
jgi:hypothetical protein